jgi:glucose dehydrogenase
VVAGVSAAVLCAAVRLPLDAAEPPVAAAPAFKSRDLVTPPRTNWITNGGNTFNQRYSPLGVALGEGKVFVGQLDAKLVALDQKTGAVAVVKLPFRLRGGTHVNWFSADELAAQEAESA